MKGLLLFIFIFHSNLSFSHFIEKNFPQPSFQMKVNKSLKPGPTLFEIVTQEFKKHYSEKIVFNIKSKTRRANAYATYNKFDIPQITITAPMLAHKRMNRETLIMLICHELGHFYAGAPKKLRAQTNKKSWSSSEGQADYYATSICFKKFKINKKLNQLQKRNENCDQTCKLSIKTSYNLAKLFAELRFDNRELNVNTKDHFKVREVILEHTNPQCRLDTLVAGSYCKEQITINQRGVQINTCKRSNFRQPECWLPNYLLQDI